MYKQPLHYPYFIDKLLIQTEHFKVDYLNVFETGMCEETYFSKVD